MKTIDRKDKSNRAKPKKQPKSFLIDHPEAHELLSHSKLVINRAYVSDIIDLKSRKDYKNRSVKFMVSSLSLCISLLLVIFVFEIRFSEKKSNVELEDVTNQFEDLVEIPQTEQVQKPPVQAQAPTIIEVNDEEIIEEIEVDLDIEMTEDTRIEEVIVAKETEEMPEEAAEEIFTIVEERPAPYGGLKAFYEYVGENLKYPPKASRIGVEGRVFIEFIVEKDGSLTDIRVAKGIGGGCDEEAVRVIKSAPNWKPGKQRGNAVRVRMVIPIMFKLYST